MGLDAGRVLKRSVLCPRCHEERLFTLREIADNPLLKCSGCGTDVCISDSVYEPLLREVRTTLAAIDAAQLAPSFMSRHTLA
jgi:uncharacterized protein (DUF983 family)